MAPRSTAAPTPGLECRQITDEHGDHQAGCSGNGDRIARYNAIRDVLFSSAQSAALDLPGKLLVWCPTPSPDLLTSSGAGAAQQLWMSTISHPSPFTCPGQALNIGVQRKLTSHSAACRSAGANCGRDSSWLKTLLQPSRADDKSCW